MGMMKKMTKFLRKILMTRDFANLNDILFFTKSTNVARLPSDLYSKPMLINIPYLVLKRWWGLSLAVIPDDLIPNSSENATQNTIILLVTLGTVLFSCNFFMLSRTFWKLRFKDLMGQTFARSSRGTQFFWQFWENHCHTLRAPSISSTPGKKNIDF